MKVRFARSSVVAYISTQIEVTNVAELHAAIRKEKSLAEDFDLNDTLKISPAKYDDAAFSPRYQIYVIGVGLIGFCNGPLSDIQDKVKTPVPQGPYYIDTDRAEHKCCWNSAIVRPLTEQEKKQGHTRPMRILETDTENAKLIRDALNFYHTHKNQN